MICVYLICYTVFNRKALPIAVAVGVVALAGLYFYLNSTF